MQKKGEKDKSLIELIKKCEDIINDSPYSPNKHLNEAMVRYLLAINPDKRDNHTDYLRDKFFQRRRGDFGIAIIIFGFCGALLFASANITGNTVGNITQISSNITAIILFVIGLVGVSIFKRK